MILENINDKFKILSATITEIKNLYNSKNITNELNKLLPQIESPEFWNSKQKELLLQNFKMLKNTKQLFDEINSDFDFIKEIIDNNLETEYYTKSITVELNNLITKSKKFYLDLLLNNEKDTLNCFLSINSGAGGTESQDWAAMLLRMYLRFCETQNFNATILDEQIGEETGLKSVTLYIKGNLAYGILKSEHGIHRLIRISPFDKNKSRHTSFAAVSVFPEMNIEKYKINPKELRIDTYRASGAGGQHVNVTDSAVRITHIPTGITVQCQNERSQLKNKEFALKILASRVQLKIEADAKNANKIQKDANEFGSQIRTYTLHPYKLIKDHRTNYENTTPDSVLDGNLIEFINAYLKLNLN